MKGPSERAGQQQEEANLQEIIKLDEHRGNVNKKNKNRSYLKHDSGQLRRVDQLQTTVLGGSTATEM